MPRTLALALTLLTGFSGLVYEVAWEKYLATLLGSHSEATATVLGLFLGGLALGYATFGRLTGRLVERARQAGRPAHLLRTYGIVEASIGLHALVFPVLFAAVRELSLLVPEAAGAFSFVFDVALSALLIGPPAVLMGATIPILTQGLARDLDDATTLHARVYALNTAGAFVGALSAGFWLVPTLGLVGVALAMACLNLAAGACYVWLDRYAPAPSEAVSMAPSASAATPAATSGWRALGAIALLSGFAMMAIQTSLIRLGALSLGASHFTFSMVVATFVSCIALGSFAVASLGRIPRALLPISLWLLVGLLVVFYAHAENGPWAAHAVRSLFRDHPAGFLPYHAAVFMALLVLIGPAIVLSGATLPLLFHELRRRFGELGPVAGRLYSLNTLGSLAGSLLGGYLLLFWLDLHHVFRLALVALAIAASLATWRLIPALGRVVPTAAGVAAIAAIALLPAWDPVPLTSGLFRLRQPRAGTFEGPSALFEHYVVLPIPFHDDDPMATITVKEDTLPDGRINRSITTNGKGDSSVLGEYTTTGMLGIVPAFLAGQAERAFVIGYGTGVTASELASLDEMKEVIVAEISPAVIEAAPLFDYGNDNASTHPRIEILRSDAYRALRRATGHFDVIVSEPSNPWVTGVEMLYSREFLETARDRLTPDGVHCQWFHTYETDDATIRMVLHTYAQVFDHVEVWFGMGEDLLLLGVRDPERANDLARLEQRAQRRDFAAAFQRIGVQDLAGLFAHQLLPMGVVSALELDEATHTLLHPRLSDSAARAFFAGRTGSLPASYALEPARVGRRNGRIQALARRHGGTLPEAVRLRVAEETCQYRVIECVPLLARWRYDDPESPVLARLIAHLRRQRRVERSMVDRVSRLYDPAPRGVAGALNEARAATRLFERFYHHAAPFPRQTLAWLWAECTDPENAPGACYEARRDAEARLGPLEVEFPGAGGGMSRLPSDDPASSP